MSGGDERDGPWMPRPSAASPWTGDAADRSPDPDEPPPPTSTWKPLPRHILKQILGASSARSRWVDPDLLAMAARSRPTIYRAVKNGKLSGDTGKDGVLTIDTSDTSELVERIVEERAAWSRATEAKLAELRNPAGTGSTSASGVRNGKRLAGKLCDRHPFSWQRRSAPYGRRLRRRRDPAPPTGQDRCCSWKPNQFP